MPRPGEYLGLIPSISLSDFRPFRHSEVLSQLPPLHVGTTKQPSRNFLCRYSPAPSVSGCRPFGTPRPSLRRLRFPGPNTPIDETARALPAIGHGGSLHGSSGRARLLEAVGRQTESATSARIRPVPYRHGAALWLQPSGSQDRSKGSIGFRS